jgi:hypothetical protein
VAPRVLLPCRDIGLEFYLIVNDTSGGIFGAHFDVFVGTRALHKQVKLLGFGRVWFAGIEQSFSVTLPAADRNPLGAKLLYREILPPIPPTPSGNDV